MTERQLFAISVFVSTVVMMGCDAAETSPPNNEPPRGESEFARNKLDIGLAMSCAACHASNLAQGGFAFADLGPDEMRQALLNAPAQATTTMPLVTPGDPDQSFLMRKLWGDFSGVDCPQGCGVKMPIGNYPYAEGDRLDLEEWIKNGAF